MIHAATLDVLEHIGVLVRNARAKNLLLDAGCVRGGGDLVNIPPHLIEEAVHKTVRTFRWHARGKGRSIRVGEGPIKLGPGTMCTNIIDLETGKARKPTREDGDNLVRLMDALDTVSIAYTPVAVEEQEFDTHVSECIALLHDYQNTGKCLVGPTYDGAMARDGLRMASVALGGEEVLRKNPFLAGFVDPVSPLIHDDAMCSAMIAYAEKGQPVFLTSLDLAGASSPATLAGTLVQQNAEVLSGLLILQLVNPKAPVIYGTVSGIMDMGAGNAALGGPELGLISAASVQLAHKYGLPCSAGAQSDSKAPDAQAAYEKAMSLLACVLAGADLSDIYAGSFEAFNTTSYEQFVIDDEIAGYALRYAQGIEVSEDTMALDILKSVGAGAGFLREKTALKHTMRVMKAEHYRPRLSDRRSRDAWQLAGSLDTRERARERVREILREHEPEPPERDIVKALEAEVERVKRERAEKI